MNHSTAAQHPWEEWQLTAFVLGELEPALAEAIRVAASSDSALAAEIESIRGALAQVTQVLKDESQITPALTPSGAAGWQRVLQSAQRATVESDSMWPAAPRRHSLPETDADQDAAHGQHPQHLSSRSRTVVGLGLLAMAASLLVAAWFSIPTVSSWMLASNERPPNSLLRNALPTSDAGTESRQSGGAPHSLLADVYGQDGQGNLPAEWGDSREFDKALSEGDLFNGNASNQQLAQSGPSAGGMMGGMGSGMAGDTQQTNEGLVVDRLDSSLGMGGYAGGAVDGIGDYGSMMGEAASDLSLAKDNNARMGMGMGMGGGPGYPLAGKPLQPQLYDNPMQDDLYLAQDDASVARFRAEHLAQEFRILGPGSGNDRFESIVENKFERVQDAPLSTFSIDVDTASYAKCRQLLMEGNQLPPAAAVRIEEFINYFDYQYASPTDDAPVAAHLAVANCPWQPEHQLVRIALQAPRLELAQRPAANIVFLLDVSGSMNEPNKLPLVKEAIRMLIEQLGENDRLAMVVYAGAAGCVLESTRGDQQAEILAALERLSAGGSTNGGDGIQLAYNLARDHYIPGGINRVILCTDGDFNVGLTNTQALVDLVVEQARSKTFLTVLGFGMGNTNDAMMEQISNRGNGIYAFVDSWREAKRQMVQQLVGNLMTVAKDVKLQVEFNPQKIKAYRLLGYENRVMAAQDFNDDQKDAGEIGAGHRVTALYEVVPLASHSSAGRPPVDELRYQPSKTIGSGAEQEPAVTATAAVEAGSSSTEGDEPVTLNRELLAVKLRYKQPEGETSQLRVFPLLDESASLAESDADFRWAVSMAEFGMLLRGSRYGGQASWSGLLEQAIAAAGATPDAQREECLQMIRRAAQLHGR